jgi:hypothetical protein
MDEYTVKLGAVERKGFAELYSKIVLKYLLANSKSYDRLEVDEQWLEKYQKDLKLTTKYKDMEEIFYREVRDSHRQVYFHHFKQKMNALKKSLKFNQVVVYGVTEDSEDLLRMAKLAKCFKSFVNTNGSLDSQKIRFFKISQDNAKRIKEIPGAIHVREFKDKFHKQLTAVQLARTFMNTIEDGVLYSKLMKPYFPKVARMYEQITTVANKAVLSNIEHSYEIENYINIKGIHPAYEDEFRMIEKIQNWYSKMIIFQHIDFNNLPSKREEPQEYEAVGEEVRLYARKTFKSTLNY